ncbi:hypothetical protein J7T55_006077 [Diaporthe amygdali]|uniref:uncharacterized protein n=1 Tax=Phomopsis amygdali TaxID=1214568 RepID=UPI0022FEA96D|nr:uncharacterized protein J7T55_006077 [Diaporthe amygdali]KAJ0124736.1 hypothetical protein J7T55_006077 [Diaporthe amygdali]
MAEAIAGLSFAANILQMVEYGGVFVTTAWKIYSSQAESQLVKDFDQLQYLTEDFKNILDCLEHNDSVNSSTESLPDRNRDLLKLAAESRKISEEILNSLNKIGNPTVWRVKKHKAIQAAFKLTWSQDHVAELQTKLDRVRSQLTLHLVHSLRSDAASSQETQKRILGKIAQDAEHLSNRIDRALDFGLGTISIDFITHKLGSMQAENVGESLKTAILGAIYEPERHGSMTDPKAFNIPLLRKQTLKEKLLSKLAYPDMLVREQSIVKAHEKTFQWIFQREKEHDRPWASFCQWLEETDKQLYWITGKAGSGKSTLMRYISQPLASGDASIHLENTAEQPRCSPFLRRWAGSQPLLIASFYFWAIGSPMQRSREGMLRTLLHELLKQAGPDMVASVMPKSWEALCLFDEDPRAYSEAMLQKMLSRALQCMSASNRICIFIDGLDEFQGEHGDLIGMFRAALDAHPIKLCISSRPWQVFEDAFQDKPSLRLQDLTLADIKTYIQSTLHPDPAFALLRTIEPSFADSLVDSIATKADGVFLWVRLVVASLQKGIKAGDRISDLKRRLDELPPDLEGLYERILDGLDPEYLDHAMQYFQLMEASLSISPPNIMVFSYADEEDEDFTINLPASPLDKERFETIEKVLKKRLNSRCMGLLEIAEQPAADTDVFVHASRSMVKYLHKTVRDYLAGAGVKERLSARAKRSFGQRFDPHLRLCSAQLGFCKSNPIHNMANSEFQEHNVEMSEVIETLSSCLSHAAKVQGTGLSSMVRLIDALNAVFSEALAKVSHHAGWYSASKSFRREESDLMDILIASEVVHQGREQLFRSLVIQHNVVEYVRAKTQPMPHQALSPSKSGKMKLLLLPKRVLSRNHGRHPYHYVGEISDLDWQLHDAVVTASPCLPMTENRSLWEITLAVYMTAFHAEPQMEVEQVWEQVVRLMVKYGAPTSRRSINKALQIVKNLHYTEKYRSEAFGATIEDNLKRMKEEA